MNRYFTLTNNPDRQDTFLPFEVSPVGGPPATALMVETFEPVAPAFVLTNDPKEATHVQVVQTILSKRERLASMFKPLK